MHEWIVAIILLCAPPDADRTSFDAVATAVEDAARAQRAVDPRELAADLVALAARESHFIPGAVGRDAFGESYGLFQLHQSNLRSAAGALDPWTAAQEAALYALESRRVCAGRPSGDRFGWYASGGNGCDNAGGLAASRNRAALADRLLRAYSPWWSPAVDHRPKHGG
jgi:hypothetical protein